MNSFCSAADITEILPIANRYSDLPDRYRRSVSQSMANYTRRNWDYDASYTEYVDSPRRRAREIMRVYPTKVPVNPSTITLGFSYTRQWDSTTLLVSGTDYYWDYDRKCLTITNAYELHQAEGAYQLIYAGGLQVLNDFEGNPTDVYDCDTPGLDILRDLCVQEATDRISTLVNQTQGEQQHGALRNRTIEKKRIAGFLPEVARQLEPYRKIYIART